MCLARHEPDSPENAGALMGPAACPGLGLEPIDPRGSPQSPEETIA